MAMMITTFDAGRPKSGKSDMNGVYETTTNRGKYDIVSIPKHTGIPGLKNFSGVLEGK